MSKTPLKCGDHVVHEHKGRRNWGIIRALCHGMFGEPRARIDWVDGDATPFPVCLESLRPDLAGVVRETLRTN